MSLKLESDTLLLRQVHPSFVQGDSFSSQVFSSQTFRPTPKDEFKLSVYNGKKFSASTAFAHFTQEYTSAGVAGVLVEECNQEGLATEEDNYPFDGHCFIDFQGLTSNAVGKKAKKLKALALKRGWLHRPS